MDHAAWLAKGVVLDVPIDRCRSALGVRSDENPFVLALAGTADKQSLLRTYYARFQPQTAADVLGLSPAEAPGYAHLDALAYVFPWKTWVPADAHKDRLMWTTEESRSHGFDLGPEDGIHLFGPTSEAKESMETTRLDRLVDSIRTDGYCRTDLDDGDIAGTILIGEGDAWCVHTESGQHRLAVLAALGYTSVPIRFDRSPVMRALIHRWPKVVSGDVTEAGATALFDRFLRGDHP